MRRLIKLENGFTLVELMVVVAIIGLLSAVAVPNFKKYQAKAKIAEAKLQLSAIYTAEASFFSDYNMYHNCLGYMGFDPSPERSNRYYTVGFYGFLAVNINTTAYATAVNSGLNSSDCPRDNAWNDGVVNPNRATAYPAGKAIGSSITGASWIGIMSMSSLGTQADANTMTYRAGATGIISINFTNPDICSRLTINENKVISTLSSGY